MLPTVSFKRARSLMSSKLVYDGGMEINMEKPLAWFIYFSEWIAEAAGYPISFALALPKKTLDPIYPLVGLNFYVSSHAEASQRFSWREPGPVCARLIVQH